MIVVTKLLLVSTIACLAGGIFNFVVTNVQKVSKRRQINKNEYKNTFNGYSKLK
jgi:membrane protein YqaA with SNARE-associated domain